MAGPRHSRNTYGESRGIAALAALPLKELWRRFSVLFFTAFALALLFMGRAESVIVEQSRRLVTDVATPLLTLVSEPVAAFRNTVESMESISTLYEENRVLKAEVDRLKRWEMTARALEQERLRLTELTNLVDAAPIAELTARMIADTSTPFSRTIIVDAGATDRVLKGQAVMDSAGVLGKIDGVGLHASRVLLVTDITSRIPVRLEKDRSPAIAAGLNENRLEILHLPKGVAVSVGDTLVTSGDGGIFPAGLKVGRVLMAENGKVYAAPTADLSRIEFIQLLRHRVNIETGDKSSRPLSPQIGLQETPQLVFRPPEPPAKRLLRLVSEGGVRPTSRPAYATQQTPRPSE